MDTLHDIGLQKNNIGYKLSEVRYMENYIRYHAAHASTCKNHLGNGGLFAGFSLTLQGKAIRKTDEQEAQIHSSAGHSPAGGPRNAYRQAHALEERRCNGRPAYETLSPDAQRDRKSVV